MTTYLIDTDVLVKLDQLPNYPAVLAAMRLGCDAGTVRTVSQVFDELKRFAKPYEEWRPLKKKMVIRQDLSEIYAIAGLIAEDFPFLFDQTGNKNRDPADPWLIACAKHYGYTLVTGERQNSSVRIPYVCRQQGINVNCLGPTDFMTEFMT